MKTIINYSKFLSIVSDNLFSASLKSYVDTLLFYYLGHVALTESAGNILEIGVGGSTLPLIELSTQHKKVFYINDINRETSLKITNSTIVTDWFSNTSIENIFCNSIDLFAVNKLKNNLSYCHIDGSKDYTVTTSDLNFCLENLCHNGLICQDDYGNNKHPAVTDAIKALEFQKKLSIIVVGDSSVWVTKPEYRDFWMSCLKNDYEFNLLAAICNLSISSNLSRYPTYYYNNAYMVDDVIEEFLDHELEYFKFLKKHQSNSYLCMPYIQQSNIGIGLEKNQKNQKFEKRWKKCWQQLKGSSWPVHQPKTIQEVIDLPEFIKQEIINFEGQLYINRFRNI